MSECRVIRNASSDQIVLARAHWCSSFWCHFKGLMLRRDLPEDEGLLFVFRREAVTETSIHMFFMNFPIAAVWLDNEGRVVGKKLAKVWRPYYAANKPARYLIEARPGLLDRVQMGDVLRFDEQV